MALIILHKYPHNQRMTLNDFGYILEGEDDHANIYMQNGSLVITHESYEQVNSALGLEQTNIGWKLD